MRIKHIIFLLPVFAAGNTVAQRDTLSLQNAVDLALVNRYDLKAQKANTQVYLKQLSEVRTRNLPQITSDLDVRYNTLLQTNILPGNVFGPGNASKEVQFGTPYNFLWGFNLNQQVYNPTNRADRRIAAAQADYEWQNEKLTAITIKQEVTEAYFSVLLWKEKVKLSQENVRRAIEVYQASKDQLGMGQATNYDVQRNEIDLENAKATDEQNARSYVLAMSDLLYKIGADSVKAPVLQDSIPSLLMQFSAPVDSGTLNRVELTQQNLQIYIYNENIKKQQMGWAPTVSVYGNYSLQYLSNNFQPFNSKLWYPFNYVGVKVSFSIFDGGLRNKTREEFQLRADAARYQYTKLRNDYRQDVLNALTTMNNAISDLNYQKKNLALIDDLYRIDKDRLKNGTIKESDLETTYYTLQQTQTNYLNSVYNYLVAIVGYKKANGSL